MVLGLILKSLIHFEFILVCGVRRWKMGDFPQYTHPESFPLNPVLSFPTDFASSPYLRSLLCLPLHFLRLGPDVLGLDCSRSPKWPLSFPLTSSFSTLLPVIFLKRKSDYSSVYF